MSTEQKKVSFIQALTTIIILGVILIVGLAYLKLATLTVFLLAILGTGLIAYIIGFSLEDIQEYVIEGCKKSLLIVLILMAVGTVIGSWMVSGIVPTIIYYGLNILSPSVFLVAGFLICCLVSFFTGSSYTAAGTLGVAFMGIGYGLGISPGLTAGMVVSGSIFGDKMSPFSDTTNLAAAVAGTDIMSHIKSMLYTTIPALIISAVLYALMGIKYGGQSVSFSELNLINETLSKHFSINPLLLLVPILTIFLVIKKVPPLISLLIGAFSGVIVAFVFQGSDVKTVLDSLANGFAIDTGVPDVDKLLNRGGISSMMGTVALAILALGFGEMLQKMGVLNAILDKIRKLILTPMNLVITTLISCLITNMLTASQYIAIIMPGEVFRPAYKKIKVAPNVLSRTLEDGGTIFSFLVPWSMAAIYVSGVLDVPTTQYLPFAFLALLCPVFAVIYAVTGFAIFKEDKGVPHDKSEKRKFG